MGSALSIEYPPKHIESEPVCGNNLTSLFARYILQLAPPQGVPKFCARRDQSNLTLRYLVLHMRMLRFGPVQFFGSFVRESQRKACSRFACFCPRHANSLRPKGSAWRHGSI